MSALLLLSSAYTSEDEDNNLEEDSNFPEKTALQTVGSEILCQKQEVTFDSSSSSKNDLSTENLKDLLSTSEDDPFDVMIPPEPTGPCPAELQEKIANLHLILESNPNLNMNENIQQKKEFRNPSLYEKMVQYCNIDEYGTNYSPENFDPYKWGKESYYEELAKTQNLAMDKLQKAKKIKTAKEIVSQIPKKHTTTTTKEDANKRKKKWDPACTNLANAVAVKIGITIQPALTTSTSSVTNTLGKKTNFHSLKKRRR